MPIFPAPPQQGPYAGGVLYASGFALPAAEGDLYDGASPGPDPIPVPFHRGISAAVEFTFQGTVTFTSACYVVMQGDFGDGTWFDLAWCGLQNPSAAGVVQNFLLSAGAYAANSFQQSRVVGTAPSPLLGSNACIIPDRIRFAGKAALSSSSSSSSGAPGVTNAVLVTIRYKLEGNR